MASREVAPFGSSIALSPCAIVRVTVVQPGADAMFDALVTFPTTTRLTATVPTGLTDTIPMVHTWPLE